MPEGVVVGAHYLLTVPEGGVVGAPEPCPHLLALLRACVSHIHTSGSGFTWFDQSQFSFVFLDPHYFVESRSTLKPYPDADPDPVSGTDSR